MNHKNIILALAAFCISLAAVCQHIIYVSPNGNDLGDGSAERPFQSLDKAFESARTMLTHDSVRICLSEGIFHLRHPLRIDSTWNLTGENSLVVQGAGMMKTVVSGGIELPPFTTLSDSLWVIDLGASPFALSEIRHLFVNGRRAILARTPNRKSMFKNFRVTQMQIDSVPVRGAKRNGLYAHKVALPHEAYQTMSRCTGPVENITVSFLHAWDMTRRVVETFSPADSAVYIVGNPMKPWNPIDREAQFFFENDRSFLDEPGEWYFDKSDRMLYYIPLPGEDIASVRAVIPVLDRFLDIEGTPALPLKNITFSDLTFAYTNQPLTRRGNDPMQAAAAVDASIKVGNAANVVFSDCEITHTGNSAVRFDDGCHDSRITSCLFHDLGAGAVRIGNIRKPVNEKDRLIRRIVVDNNIFHSGGRIFPTAVGVLLTHAADVVISHNDIADFYYSGISAGWVWGYTNSPSVRNKIIYNKVHHIGRGMLSDMGGIYTLGPSEGTVIANNVVHDIYSYSYGGWGIYTDEGSSGILIRDNLVYNCKSSGFHQHYGRDNIITNNIFANQTYAQLEATEIENHRSFTFTNNIVYHSRGKMYGIKWDSVSSYVDNNIYWLAGRKTVMFNDHSFEQWKKLTGHDKKSIIADPEFIGIETGEFRVTNNRAIKKIGFRPFDSSEAGVYGGDQWVRMSLLDPKIIHDFREIVRAYEAVPDNEKPKKMNFKK